MHHHHRLHKPHRANDICIVQMRGCFVKFSSNKNIQIYEKK